MSDSDPTVGNYEQALAAFAPYCQDSRISLGDLAVTSQKLLANGSQSETLLNILRHVRAAIPAGSPRMRTCSDIFGAYVVLRGGKPS